MRPFIVVAFGLFLPCLTGCGRTPAGGKGDPPPMSADLKKIQGVWKVEAVDTGDPKDTPPIGEFDSVRFVFKGSLFFITGRKGTEAALVTLDPEKTPKHFDTIEADEKSEPLRVIATVKADGPVYREPVVHQSIYKFEGDKLLIALNKGGGERPTEFKAIPFDFKAPPTPDPKPLRVVVVVTLAKTDEPTPEFEPRKRFDAWATAKALRDRMASKK